MGGPSKPKGPERGFGDFVVLDSVHVRGGGTFRLTIPWHTDDTLRGVKRDSAIRVNMARKDHEIRKTREGLTQTYRWTNAYVFPSHIRVADPDTAGIQAFISTRCTSTSRRRRSSGGTSRASRASSATARG